MNLPTPLMTLAEATEKHTQLKLLHKVVRGVLLEIRDRQGYIALGFASFEEYGEKEWGYSKSHIHRLATAEEIQQSLSPIGDLEISESQLRPLGKVPKAARDEIYQQAKAEAEEQGKALTAKAVDVAVNNYLEKLNTAQTTIVGIESELQHTTSQLKHLDNLYQHQSKDVDKVIKEHSALVEEFNELEASIDAKAEKIADEKVAENQKAMQQQLDAEVARVEAENQAKIDEQKDIIARLKNTIAQTTQAENKVERDERYLADLQEEIDEANAALKKLTIENNDATAAKRTNHAYTGIAKALANDTKEYIDDINNISHLVDENGNPIPLYPLTADSKDYLQEVALVLSNAAQFIKHLASYEAK